MSSIESQALYLEEANLFSCWILSDDGAGLEYLPTDAELPGLIPGVDSFSVFTLFYFSYAFFLFFFNPNHF